MHNVNLFMYALFCQKCEVYFKYFLAIFFVVFYLYCVILYRMSVVAAVHWIHDAPDSHILRLHQKARSACYKLLHSLLL